MATAATTPAGVLIHVSGDGKQYQYTAPSYIDTPIATNGNDIFSGGDGNDAIFAGGGSDTLYGGAGNDWLDGGVLQGYDEDGAADLLYGGDGDDYLVVRAGDQAYGGAGSDTAQIFLRGSTASFTLDLDKMLSGATISFVDTQTTTVVSGIEHIEALTLGSGNDSVTTSAAAIATIPGKFYPFGITLGDGDDTFHLIGTYTTGLKVDAGVGFDTLILDGDYSTRFIVDGSVGSTNSNFSGFNIFKLTAVNSYNLVISNQTLETWVDGSALTAADSMTVALGDNRGVLGGAGDDTVIVSSYRTYLGSFDLGGGQDTLVLNGDFRSGWYGSIGTELSGVETIRLTHDILHEYGYYLTLSDKNVAAGTSMTIDGSALTFGLRGFPEQMRINASAETDGSFTMLGGAADDTLIGGQQADLIYGGNGNDILNGGGSADTLYGSAGDDTYYVDNIGDKVIEPLNAGNDTVYSSVDFGLSGQFIETLRLTDNAISATGNNQENALYGNEHNNVLNGLAGADYMAGGAGDDTYYVDTIGDRVIEADNEGNDTVYSSVNFNLAGQFIENLHLTGTDNIYAMGNGLANMLVGNSGNNVLDGGNGDDILDGGSGADTMYGGAGNDIFYVDNSGDKVIEAVGGGNDTVYSSVDFSLAGQFIETLQLTGTNNINATGNNQANTLIGNSGANILNGKDGLDILTGGGGADIFVFDTILSTSNVKTITDFSAADDLFQLAHAVFSALPTGTLDQAAFYEGATAQNASQHIIYNSATGNIYYDADGNGADAALLFAHVTPGTTLTTSDFHII